MIESSNGKYTSERFISEITKIYNLKENEVYSINEFTEKKAAIINNVINKGISQNLDDFLTDILMLKEKGILNIDEIKQIKSSLSIKVKNVSTALPEEINYYCGNCKNKLNITLEDINKGIYFCRACSATNSITNLNRPNNGTIICKDCNTAFSIDFKIVDQERVQCPHCDAMNPLENILRTKTINFYKNVKTKSNSNGSQTFPINHTINEQKQAKKSINPIFVLGIISVIIIIFLISNSNNNNSIQQTTNKSNQNIDVHKKSIEEINYFDNFLSEKGIKYDSNLIKIELIDINQIVNTNLGYKGPTVFEFKIYNNMGIEIKELSVKMSIYGIDGSCLKETFINISNLKNGESKKKEYYFYKLSNDNVYRSDVPWVDEIKMKTEKLIIDNVDITKHAKYLSRYFSVKSHKKSVSIEFL